MDHDRDKLLEDDLKKNWIPHLQTQFKRGRPILFTGAGFSAGALNTTGEPIPGVASLRKQLWGLAFPGEEHDESASLQDLYEKCVLHHSEGLSQLLFKLYTVDENSLPAWYSKILRFPWQRFYTLNIDDLPSAVSRKYTLPRKIVPISAVDPQRSPGNVEFYSDLECVHLNGSLQDVPNHVTFSVTQYAERLAQHDPWYLQLSADLLTSPFIFIGTQLDEPPLWQHIALRKAQGSRKLNELRHRSYLVTPTLDKARQALLSQLHVVWLPMTGEEFTSTVLPRLKEASEEGNVFLAARKRGPGPTAETIPDVAELAKFPNQQNEFLMGQEPIWADLQADRAIYRECDDDIWNAIQRELKREKGKRPIAILGTAGSGKSTSFMRACLRLSAAGVRIAWVDRFGDISPRQIRVAMRGEDAPPVLAIDDADQYGTELASMVKNMHAGENPPLILLGIRSSKVDRSLSQAMLGEVKILEIAMPHLADTDIEQFIDLLDRENRLGILKGKPRRTQVEAFRDQAGRQLLVAMIQATSGRDHKEKAILELADLDESNQLIYSIIAVATSFRFGLTRDEILIALGEQTNEALNGIEQLVRRHIVVSRPDGYIWARHKVIAELIHSDLQQAGRLNKPVYGLAFLAAAKSHETMTGSPRPKRMLIHFLNHEYLYRVGEVDYARTLYADLENTLSWDYHFWLQRGSIEVEYGDLALAEHFLNTARGIKPQDVYLENEWAYLLFRKAISNPKAEDSSDMVKEAMQILEDLIPRTRNTYPYHVLGSQGLAWARRGVLGSRSEERFLGNLTRHLKDGCERYPLDKDLERLRDDLQREYLGLAVKKP